MQSHAGQLIRSTQELDFACERRMNVDWANLPADEVAVLKHICFERQRRSDELRARQEEAARAKGQ